MFCTRCGAALNMSSNFCIACKNAEAPSHRAPTITLSKLFIYAFGIHALLAAVSYAVGLFANDAKIGFSVGNIVLELELALAMLFLAGGGIAGAVFLIKAASAQGPQKAKDARLGKILLFGPIVWIIIIIFSYVIINVVRQLLAQ